MKTSLYSATALGLLVSFATPLGVAQETDTDAAEKTLDTVVVKGLRNSLEQAAEIKRNSTGVVDAITAEDIGKFPDANLAESLQRIAGVSIDRSNNEGNRVTVRGFGPNFNLVLLNGRQMPSSTSLASAGVSRSFAFRELASEGVSAIEVYKTGQADIDSGGLGATINVMSPRPFDSPGFRAVGSVKGNFDTNVEEGDTVTPELAGLISNTFADDKFGVQLLASYSERNSRRDRVGTSDGAGGGWRRNRGNPANIDLSAINTTLNPTQTFWTPFTIDNDIWDTERERLNIQGTVQARPIDSLEITADYTMSRFEQTTAMNRMSYWFDTPDIARANENGTLVEITSIDDELNFWSWDFFERTENDSYGINMKWQATGSLSLEFDAHDSTSKSNPNGETAETLANLRNRGKFVSISGTYSADLPTVSFDDSLLPGGGAYDPANIISDLFQKRGFSMDNNVQQYKLSGRWENLGDGGLSAINFGTAYTDYTVDTAQFATFAFVDIPLDGLDLSFVDSGYANMFPQIPRYRVTNFIDIVEQEGLFFENPPQLDGVNEVTTAYFVSADFDTEFNNMPLKANAGVRYEETDVDAYSVQEGIFGFNFRNEVALQTIFDGVEAPQFLSSGYSVFLPNVAVSLEPKEDLLVKASYSKTIARSNIGSMFPGQSVSGRVGGPFNASQGNPGLLPYESDNLDLSVEYYYSPGSYASVGLFKKDVDNFIGSVTSTGEVLNSAGIPITDPSINPRGVCPDGTEPPNPDCLSQPGDPVVIFDISSVDNLRAASVQGLEATIQHMFGDTGFGVIANATIVDGDVEVDVYQIGETFALTGLSDSANLVGFYEKGPIQARIAYNWRDEFLLGFRAQGEPAFTEAYGQFDLSASYDINDQINVFFEGLNVTNEKTRRHGRFPEQLIDYEEFGARYSIGVRATF